MSQDRPTIFLDALVALYRADPAGALNLSAPVWIGCCHEGYGWEEEYPAAEITATGELTQSFRRFPALHRVELERIWMIPVRGADFTPHHGDAYGLVITWQDQKTERWFQRCYWGVQTLARTQRSAGIGRVEERLSFRARQVTGTPGQGATAAIPEGVWQNVLFARDATWASGDFLYGVYRWNVPVRIRRASLHPTAQAVVRLVMDNLFPHPLELDSADLQAWEGDIYVPAGTQVRWQVTEVSGASPAGAVVMGIVPEPLTTLAVPDLQTQLIAWMEAESFSRLESVYDVDNVLASASVVWPDGVTGNLTVTQKNATHYTVDSFTVSYLRPAGGPLLVTQGQVERNAFGDVTHKPRPTVSPLP